MNFGAADEIIVEFSDGLTKKNSFLKRAEAEEFFLKIIEIIAQPEALSGFRHVEIRYHAEVEWKNLSFAQSRQSGEFKSVSNEWLTEELEYFLPELEKANPQSAENLRNILKKGLHRRAIEIYLATKMFGKKYFSAG